MSETLAITKQAAIEAYAIADDKGKAILAALCGKDTFYTEITDRVKTFTDVLAIKGISEKSFTYGCAGMTPDEIAYKQIKLIAEVLNEGWTPDWTNSNERKFYPYFDFSSGLSYNDYYYYFQFSFVGSRLCFKNSELAQYAGTQFLGIYKSFLTIQ